MILYKVYNSGGLVEDLLGYKKEAEELVEQLKKDKRFNWMGENKIEPYYEKVKLDNSNKDSVIEFCRNL